MTFFFFSDPRIIFDRHDPRETSIGSKLELLGEGGKEKRRGRGELIAYPGKQHPLERDVPLPGMLHLPRQLRIRVLQPLYRNSPPPSTLTHCPPPPPLHSGHFTWNDNHPRQNDPIASRNNIAKISYNSGKLWTGSSSPFFF